MEIIKQGSFYYIYFDYTPVKTEAVKRIGITHSLDIFGIKQEVKLKPSPYFNAEKKCWIVSDIHYNQVEQLRHRFCPQNETAKLQQRIFAVKPLPELNIEISLAVNPYPYQRNAIAFNLENKRTLNGDDMGLGKTFETVATIVAAGCKCTLVICPNSVKNQWQKEFKNKGCMNSVILNSSIKNKWQAYHTVTGIRVFIINYESLKSFFVQEVKNKTDKKGKVKKETPEDYILRESCKYFDCIVIDESHKVKDSNTIIYKVCKALTVNREYRFLLSGTPIVNNHKDIYTQLCLMGNLTRLFTDKKYFLDRYCGGASGNKSTNGQELQSILRNTCFFRRLESEVKSDLPDNTRNIITCDIDNQPTYDYAKNEFANYLKTMCDKSDAEISKSMRMQFQVQFMKLRKVAAMGKLQAVYDRINEVLENGKKYVVFVHHKDVAEAILSKYPKATKITADCDLSQRTANIERFTKDKDCNLIVCSLKCASTGVDGLQHGSHLLGFVELPWHPAECGQAEARIKRGGQTHPCQFDYFLGKDTVDESVYEIIERKRDIAVNAIGEDNEIKEIYIDKLNTLFNQKK